MAPASLASHSQQLPSPFVVCITGASRGVGAETAKAFAQAGATGLILTARTVAALDQTRRECHTLAKKPAELKISCLAADAGSEDSAKHIASTVKAEQGSRLDVLINSAGLVSTDASAFDKLDAIGSEQIQKTMQVNYMGRFWTIKHLLPLLLASPNGAKTVVNITSFSSHFATMGAMGFNISELATNRLTEAVAETYGEQGVVAYSVHPGMVRTTPPPGFPEAMLEFAHDDPGLCGAFLIWLVKEKREWLTGRYLSSNWDVEELEEKREEIVAKDKLKMRMVV